MNKSGLLFLLMAPISALSAQETDTLEPESEVVVAEKAVSVRNPFDAAAMNFIKLNATSLVAKNFSFQYERVLSRHISVALGFRFMPKTGLPFGGTLEDVLVEDGSPETERFVHDARAGGFAVTPELRYYIGAGSGKGFYLAPFARYEHFSLSSTYIFTAPDNSVQSINFNGGDDVLGIGLMIGSQFRLSDHIYLDWWIAGPYYTHHSLDLNAAGFNITQDEAAVLQEELNKIELLNFDMKASVTNTTANLRSGGSLAALRAFGLCLSVRF